MTNEMKGALSLGTSLMRIEVGGRGLERAKVLNRWHIRAWGRLLV